MRRLAPLALLLALTACAAFAPSKNPDGTPGKSKAQEIADETAPFLPPPFGDLAKIAAGLLAGAAGTHVHHKRKAKRAAADAKPAS